MFSRRLLEAGLLPINVSKPMTAERPYRGGEILRLDVSSTFKADISTAVAVLLIYYRRNPQQLLVATGERDSFTVSMLKRYYLESR